MKMRAPTVAGLACLLPVVSAGSALFPVIDEWNGGSTEVVDLTADDMGNFALRGEGVWPDLPFSWGKRDRAFANLSDGDGTRTQDGSQGYGVNDANSTGHGYWSWTVSQWIVGPVLLSYAADLAGFDIIATFTLDGQLTRQIHWSDLSAAGLPGPVLQLRVGSRPKYAQFNEVYLEWFSVGGAFAPPGNYDGYVAAGTDLGLTAAGGGLYVDDFGSNVPEPGSLMLFGLGLAGLGLGRRRIAECLIPSRHCSAAAG
jgi:hypothetical protein